MLCSTQMLTYIRKYGPLTVWLIFLVTKVSFILKIVLEKLSLSLIKEN